jgi:zinc transport system ATP-binding protein
VNPSAEPLISCHGLTLGYEGKIVVSNLSFTVNSGDCLCITGDNGSGKTTLMKALLNLKAPISGQIIISPALKTKEIGYMPQQTQIQKDFPATVREVVRSGLLNRTGLRPFYNAAEKALAEKNMQKLGIAYLVNHCYRELSGGQQQRTLLARALCAAQKILLLDEPTAGLDPQATTEMYHLLQTLNQDGITIIMITHDNIGCISHKHKVINLSARKKT